MRPLCFNAVFPPNRPVPNQSPRGLFAEREDRDALRRSPPQDRLVPPAEDASPQSSLDDVPGKRLCGLRNTVDDLGGRNGETVRREIKPAFADAMQRLFDPQD